MAQGPEQEQVKAQIRTLWVRLDEWVQRFRWLLLLAVTGVILLLTLVITIVGTREAITEKIVVKETVVMRQVVTRVVTATPTKISTLTPRPTHTTVFTPSSTPGPATSPPLVSNIIPAATVQGSGHPFLVTITGQNFASGVTARLDGSISITVTSNTTTTIIGVLSPEVPIGVYNLTVTNPDGQSDTLSPIFIVQESVESGLTSPVLVMFGSDAE